MKKIISVIFLVLILNVAYIGADVVINENEKDPVAQYEIGMKYLNGNGVTKNYYKAFAWLKKSAEQNNANAQYELAGLYASGLGNLTQSDKEAFKWYKKASDNDHGEAKFYLGEMYQNARATPANPELALKYYEESASYGCTDAQYTMGELYYTGTLVNKDYSKAYRWFLKAAEQGDAKSQYWLANLYKNGQGVAKDFEKALEWYKKSASQEYAKAETELGSYYYDMKNYKAAVKWYDAAANQGDSDAEYAMGLIYYNGEVGRINFSASLEYFRRAMVGGNEDAIFMLGMIYYHGYEVGQDYQEAMGYFKDYEKLHNDSETEYILGCMYSDGEGVPVNKEIARKWFEKSAAQGHEGAIERMKQITGGAYQAPSKYVTEQAMQEAKGDMSSTTELNVSSDTVKAVVNNNAQASSEEVKKNVTSKK